MRGRRGLRHSDALIARIFGAIAAGVSGKAAAAHAGAHRNTLYGRQDVRADENTRRKIIEAIKNG